MLSNDELKRLLEENNIRMENEKKTLIEALQLKMRLMPPAPSQQSKKDEESNKKMLPACGRCGDSHLGGCMKPPKPK